MTTGSGNLGTATLVLRTDARGFRRGLQRAEQDASATFKRLGEQARVAGLALSAAGAALLAPIALGVSTFARFEQAMAQVKAVSGATAEEFQALTAIAKEMGTTTVFTANQSAQALAFMSMAGLTARESIEALPDVLNLAAAGQLELADAADIVTNVMAGYGIASSEATKATDVLTTGFTSTNTNLLQLGEAFKLGGPVAKAAGLAFEETAASLALMGNAGFQGTLAGTALRGAITHLLNPTSEAAEILEALGVSATDSSGELLPLVDIVSQFETVGLSAGDAMAVFGQRAGPGMLALIEQGSAGLERLTVAMEQSGGTAERIAKIQLDTFSGQMTLLKSAVEGVALSIGESLTPTLERLVKRITPITQGITKWAEENPRLFRTLVIVAGAIGAAALAMGVLLVAISLVIPAINQFTLATIAAWGAATLGITLLIAAGVALWQNWDWVKEQALKIWDKIGATVETAVNRIIDVINGLTIVMRKVFSTILSVAKWVGKALGIEMPQAIDSMIKALDEGIPHVDIYKKRLGDTAKAVAELTEEQEKALESEAALRGEIGKVVAARARELREAARLAAAEHELEEARVAHQVAVEKLQKAQEEYNHALAHARELAEDTTASEEDRVAAGQQLKAAFRQLNSAESEHQFTMEALLPLEERLSSLQAESARLLDDYQKSLSGTDDGLTAVTRASRGLEDAQLRVAAAVEKVQALVADSATDMEAYKEANEELGEANLDFGKAQRVAKRANELRNKALAKGKDVLAELRDEMATTQEQLPTVEQATEDYSAAVIEATAAEKALEDALLDQNVTLEELSALREGATEVTTDLKNAEDALSDAKDRQIDIDKRLLKADKEYIKKRLELEDAFRDDVAEDRADFNAELESMQAEHRIEEQEAEREHLSDLDRIDEDWRKDRQSALETHLQRLQDIRTGAAQKEADAELDRTRSIEDINRDFERDVEKLRRQLGEKFFGTPDADIVGILGQVGADTKLLEAHSEGMAELTRKRDLDLEDVAIDHGRTLKDIAIDASRDTKDAHLDHTQKLEDINAQHRITIEETNAAHYQKMNEIRSEALGELGNLEEQYNTEQAERLEQYENDRLRLWGDHYEELMSIEKDEAGKVEARRRVHLGALAKITETWAKDSEKRIRRVLGRGESSAAAIAEHQSPATVSPRIRNPFESNGIVTDRIFNSPTLATFGQAGLESEPRLSHLTGLGASGPTIVFEGPVLGVDALEDFINEAELLADRQGRERALR